MAVRMDGVEARANVVASKLPTIKAACASSLGTFDWAESTLLLFQGCHHPVSCRPISIMPTLSIHANYATRCAPMLCLHVVMAFLFLFLLFLFSLPHSRLRLSSLETASASLCLTVCVCAYALCFCVFRLAVACIQRFRGTASQQESRQPNGSGKLSLCQSEQHSSQAGTPAGVLVSASRH